VPPGGLLEKLAARAADIISTFRPQATSNTLCVLHNLLKAGPARPWQAGSMFVCLSLHLPADVRIASAAIGNSPLQCCRSFRLLCGWT